MKHPRISLGAATLEFPVELPSGSWLEANGPDDCAAFGPRGEPLGKVTPRGDWPMLPAGVTSLQFSCEPNSPAQPRARVTVFSRAEQGLGD